MSILFLVNDVNYDVFIELWKETMKGFLCIILFCLLSQPNCNVSKQTAGSENTNSSPVTVNANQTPTPSQTTLSPNENSNQNNNADDNKFNSYLGCWYGMRGGRVKITKNKIYDLYKNRAYTYKEISKRKTDKGEEHLLECNGDFSIGFWGKYVRILFLITTQIGITTFDSLEDYDNDRPTGEGLFDLFPCDKFFTKQLTH